MVVAGIGIVMGLMGLGKAAKAMSEYVTTHQSARQVYLQLDQQRKQGGVCATLNATTVTNVAAQHKDAWGTPVPRVAHRRRDPDPHAGPDKAFDNADDVRFDEAELQAADFSTTQPGSGERRERPRAARAARARSATIRLRFAGYVRAFPDAQPAQHALALRVRYPECDPMGYLHHSIFLQYFEMGRVELLRALGFSYADMERDGVFFVVAKVEVKYKAPARYDEELTLTTRVVRQTHVRIDHAYELRRGETLLAEATTTIACVGRDGQVRQIPDYLMPPAEPSGG